METTTRNQNCVHEPTVGNPKFWLFCMPIRQSSSSYSFQDVEVVLEDSTYVNPWNDGTEVNSDIVLVHSIPLMCRRWETVPVCCPSTPHCHLSLWTRRIRHYCQMWHCLSIISLNILIPVWIENSECWTRVQYVYIIVSRQALSVSLSLPLLIESPASQWCDQSLYLMT